MLSRPALTSQCDCHNPRKTTTHHLDSLSALVLLVIGLQITDKDKDLLVRVISNCSWRFLPVRVDEGCFQIASGSDRPDGRLVALLVRRCLGLSCRYKEVNR